MTEKYLYPINIMTKATILLLITFLFVSHATNCFSGPLTIKEREWLKQNEGKITLALETNYPPFLFVDKNGKSSGLATDYIKLIQKKLDFSLQEIKFESFGKIIQSAKNYEIDVVNAVTETEDRSRYLLFTKPFVEIPNVIIVKKDKSEPFTIDKLKNLKVSTVKNYAITEYLSKNYSYLDIDLVPDELTALLSVSFNRTDCAILDLATASYLIHQKGITNLRVAGDAGYDIKLSIASRKDWPVLNQILNKGLEAIRIDERESIRNNWISIDQINSISNKTFWNIVISITSVFLFCILAVLIWNRSLKNQVNYRTNQLAAELEERKKIEISLHESEAKYRDILKSAIEGFWLTDTNGRLLEINDAYCRMSGYSESELLNMFIPDLEAVQTPQRIAEHMKKVIKSGSDRFESKHRRKDGTIFDVEVNIQFNPDKDGRCTVFLRDVTEKRSVEKRLKSNEQKLQQLVSNISDVIVILNQDGIITYKSPNIKEHFGWHPDELLGKHGLVTVHPNDHNRVQRVLENLLKKDRSKSTVEYNYLCKDGSYKPVELTAVNLINDPLINGVLANYKDITERKNSTKALHKSEEKFRLAFLTSPDAINLNRVEDGVYLEINQGFTKIMGYSRKDVIDKSSIELNIWKNKKDREHLIEGLRKTGMVENLEAEFIGKNGDIKTGLMSAQVLNLGNENIILSITRDITEKKEIEQKLIESEEQYREYFEENLAGSYISTPDGQLIACNQEYLKIFGFKTKQDAIMTPITHLYEKPDKRNEFINTLAKNQHVLNKETSLKRIDGTFVTVVENASGLFAMDGNLTHIRGFLLDISEKKLLEAQIQQAQKMETIGTLAGGIAHDFNNILFPVVGHAEMLLEDTPSASPFRDSIEEIYSSALRAKELVKQILTFSRQEKGEIRLFKIQPVIKEVLGLIRSTIPTTIDIVQNIQKDCGPIKADPTQIHQIIMNLTTNAYHAMEISGGEMGVELKEVELGHYDLVNPDMKPGPYACLSIKDTGVGIKNEIMTQIFDPFFTTKEKGKGTGMGLSVVHGIVKSLNGGIQVQSHQGKGTEFQIYFPVQKTIKNDEAQKHTIIIGGNEHILLVDDETSIIAMQEQLLTRLGYQVTSFKNSFEALDSFRNNPDQYDLIITDLAMPKMPGDQFSEEILRLKPDMKIILCTGFGGKITPNYASAIGIKGLLEKPIVKSELAKKIREILEN